MFLLICVRFCWKWYWVLIWRKGSKVPSDLKPRPNPDRNMPTQHVATLLGATCCVRLASLLRHVGCYWLKFDQFQTWANNSLNRSQQGGQTHATCCAQQFCDMLCCHVAIVWMAGASVLQLQIRTLRELGLHVFILLSWNCRRKSKILNRRDVNKSYCKIKKKNRLYGTKLDHLMYYWHAEGWIKSAWNWN